MRYGDNICRVVESCKTIDQLDVAGKYVCLWFKRLEQGLVAAIARGDAHHVAEFQDLCKENVRKSISETRDRIKRYNRMMSL